MISKIYVLTILTSTACANLCAGGAGPAGQPAHQPLPFATNLTERSALQVAQQIFNTGTPTFEEIEGIIPEHHVTRTAIINQIHQRLYVLCEQTIGRDGHGNRALVDRTFLNRPEWLRLWFARNYFAQHGEDVGRLFGINDIGDFPLTTLMHYLWFTRPKTIGYEPPFFIMQLRTWDLENLHISDFAGFERLAFHRNTRLISLNLRANKLTTLPATIGNLTYLEMLDLGNNRLAALTPEIGNLTHLKILRLDNNQLTSLPPELSNLGHLELLVLNNNPALGAQAKTYSGKQEIEAFFKSPQQPKKKWWQFGKGKEPAK